MSIFQVPLTVGKPQQLNIQLSGIDYSLTLKYRNSDDGPGWVLDIADLAGNPIINGMPLVTGCNLLDQYRHLFLGGGLYVQTTSNPDAVPTFQNLGSDGLLYWVDGT